MVRWFLFETRAGDLLLALFERLTGLGLVVLDERDRAEPVRRWSGNLSLTVAHPWCTMTMGGQRRVLEGERGGEHGRDADPEPCA